MSDSEQIDRAHVMPARCPVCDGLGRITVVRHIEDASRTMLTKPECVRCRGTGWVLERA